MSPGPDAFTVPPAEPPSDAASHSVTPALSPTSSPAPAGPPTGADILRWCAAASPQLWFPSVQAKVSGIPRTDFDNPLWVLRQSGLVRVGDWVKGLGQGFALTPEGEAAVANPAKAPPPGSPPIPTPTPPPTSEPAKTPEPTLSRKTERTRLDRGEMAREAILNPPPSVVAPALLYANVAWFLVGAVVAWRVGASSSRYLTQGDQAVMLRIGAVSGVDLLHGEWWRLLTSAFAHFGIFHLFANMFALVMLGPIAESLWGRWRFAAIYLVGGLAGSCLAMALRPDSCLAGASGAIWAIQTCVVVWLVRYREHLPEAMVQGALRTLLLVMFVNAAVSFVPGISWEGHLGGAIAGVLAAILLDIARPDNLRRGQLALVGLGFLILAGPLGLMLAMHTTSEWERVSAREALRSLQDVDPSDVNKVQARVTFVLITPTPNREVRAQRIAEAREVVASLQGKIAVARETLREDILQGSGPPARARVYLSEIEKLAQILDSLLAGDAPLPGVVQWGMLGEQVKAVTTAWNAILPAP